MKKVLCTFMVCVCLFCNVPNLSYASSSEKEITREILTYLVSADAPSNIFAVCGTMVYQSSQNKIIELRDLYLGRYDLDNPFYHPGFNPDSVIIGNPTIINNGTCAIVTVTYQRHGNWTSEVLTFYP